MIILLKYADKLIIIMQYFKYMFEKQIYVVCYAKQKNKIHKTAHQTKTCTPTSWSSDFWLFSRDSRAKRDDETRRTFADR